MSRLDELEKEELEAEGNDESEEDEPTKADLDSISDKISLQKLNVEVIFSLINFWLEKLSNGAQMH